jgi:prepilin-type N-terminal cleavage/methylation domain-containing protein
MKGASTQTRRGFTLIELMIALAAGTIAIGAVYYLSGTANQTYSTQMRVAETQMALRMAGEQIRRDFGRAGYLATAVASNVAQPSCATSNEVTTTVAFQALEITPNGSVASPLTALMGTNTARLDSVQMVGNFASGEDYLISPPAAGATINFDPTDDSFRRTFGTDPTVWQTAFAQTFAPGRMLRIEDGDGRRFFYDIASAAGAVPSVTLSTSPPVCVTAGTSVASPVMRIQYDVVPINGTDTEFAFQGLESTLPGGQRMALVRRELSMVDGSNVVGSERVVLDYVTEFQVDAIIDTTGTGVFQVVNEGSTPDLSTVQSSQLANQLRSAVVTVSARSPDLDRKVTNIGRIDGAMVTFLVGTDPSETSYGVARVRTLRTEIFLYNLMR